MNDIKKWIKIHEGLVLMPYKDTVNKWTIGYGRNIEDNGISVTEADFMFDNDFNRCTKELVLYPWFTNQPVFIQYALLDMCFNLGIKRLLGFRKMIEAITVKDYTKAALEALNSKWAEQVGDRAKDVALMMRQG